MLICLIYVNRIKWLNLCRMLLYELDFVCINSMQESSECIELSCPYQHFVFVLFFINNFIFIIELSCPYFLLFLALWIIIRSNLNLDLIWSHYGKIRLWI